MDTKTQLVRGRDGVSAKTDVVLPDGRVLKIDTHKRNGVASVGTVVTMSPDGMGYSYMLFQDFSKVLAEDRGARATAANITAVHARALAGLDATLLAIRDHYAAKAAA